VEEHHRWRAGADRVVNAHGEVFEAAISSKLLGVFGPEARPWKSWPAMPSDRLLRRSEGKWVLITLSARRAWQLRLDDGMVLAARTRETWRRDSQARIGFTRAPWHGSAGASHVDLRYSNGLPCAPPTEMGRQES